MKQILKDKAFTFGLLLCLVFFCMNFTMDFLLMDEKSRVYVYAFNSLIGAVFFTLPYFIIAPRWRPTLWIALAFESIFLLTNHIYFNVFGDFYFLSSVDPGALFSGVVAESTASAVTWNDLIFIVLPLALIVPYRKWHKEITTTRYPATWRGAAVMAMIIIPVALFGLHIRRVLKNEYVPEADPTMRGHIMAEVSRLRTPTYKMSVWVAGNAIYLTAHLVAEFFPPEVTLTRDEFETANRLLDGSGKSAPEEYAAILAANRDKNLILIIVESLETYAIHSPEGEAASPVLHSLISDSMTVFADSILTRVGRNMSADGQMMINAGLFPLLKRPASPSMYDGDLPSIAKSLPEHYPVEAICENKEFYSHTVTNRAYGYKAIFDRLAEGKKDVFDYESDTYLFKKLEGIVGTLPQPFFLQVTTLSMHVPYDGNWVKPRIDRSLPVFRGLDPLTLGYLDKLKCFDTALGGFLDFLKAKGLYDNSVIVLVADHSPIRTYLPDESYSPYIPFIALNTGISHRARGVRAQVDVFPTILDLMGAKGYVFPRTGKPYHGLGTSLLLPPAPVADSIPDLCEKLFYSKYFKP